MSCKSRLSLPIQSQVSADDEAAQSGPYEGVALPETMADVYAEALVQVYSRDGELPAIASQLKAPGQKLILQALGDEVLNFYEMTSPKHLTPQLYVQLSQFKMSVTTASWILMYYDLYGQFTIDADPGIDIVRSANARIKYLRSKTRIDYYRFNIRIKSVVEMARELGTSQNYIYFQTWYFREEISSAWNAKVPPDLITTINSSYPAWLMSEESTFIEIAESAVRVHGAEIAEVARVLQVSEESLAMFLHYSGVRPSGRVWSKVEEGFLRRFNNTLTIRQMANFLGRTERAVAAKRLNLGLTSDVVRSNSDFFDATYGIVVGGGEIQDSGFVAFVKDHMGLKPAELAALLGVAESTVKTHLLKNDFLVSTRGQARKVESRSSQKVENDELREKAISIMMEHYFATFQRSYEAKGRAIGDDRFELVKGEILPLVEIASRINIQFNRLLSYGSYKGNRAGIFLGITDLFIVFYSFVKEMDLLDSNDLARKAAVRALNFWEFPLTQNTAASFFDLLKADRPAMQARVVRDVIGPHLYVTQSWGGKDVWAKYIVGGHRLLSGQIDSLFPKDEELFRELEKWRLSELDSDNEKSSERYQKLATMNFMEFRIVVQKAKGESPEIFAQRKVGLSNFFDQSGMRKRAQIKMADRFLTEVVVGDKLAEAFLLGYSKRFKSKYHESPLWIFESKISFNEMTSSMAQKILSEMKGSTASKKPSVLETWQMQRLEAYSNQKNYRVIKPPPEVAELLKSDSSSESCFDSACKCIADSL